MALDDDWSWSLDFADGGHDVVGDSLVAFFSG